MNASTLIKADEIARYFGVTVATVNRWVRRGLIPCVRVTRKVIRFDISTVRDALAAQAATLTVESRTGEEVVDAT